MPISSHPTPSAVEMRNLIACAVAIFLVICTSLLGPISNGKSSGLSKQVLYDAVARPEIPLVSSEDFDSPKNNTPQQAMSPTDTQIMDEDAAAASSPSPRPAPVPTPVKTPTPAQVETDKVQNLLEIHWDNGESAMKVCRIHKACLSSDGKIYVPAWMKQYAPFIAACDVRNIVYSDKVPANPEHKVDLLGSVPLRWHMPHFTTDLLAALYAQEIIRTTFSKPQWKSHRYYTKKSVSRNGVVVSFKPAFYAEQRISTFDRYDWVPQVLTRLPNNPFVAKNPDLVYPPKNGMKCFRSIIGFDSKGYARQNSVWYGPKNPFFSDRTSIFNDPISQDSSEGCKIKVTVINRRGMNLRTGPRGKKYQIGRDISNIEELIAELKRHPLLDVSVAYFERSSFEYQLRHVQNADIIIATHGGSLANLIFARRDVAVIELFPWGYRPPTFETLARALSIRYRGIDSKPEPAYLKECLENALGNSTDPDLNKWKFKTISAATVRSTSYNSALFPASAKIIKYCVRSQRIETDVVRMGSLTVREANTICRQRATK